MKRFTLLVLLVIFVFTLFGCAGGGSGAGGSGGDTLNSRGSGSISLKINWPSGSKSSVLSSAYSIKLNVCTQSTTSTGATQYLREVNALVVTHASANTSENKTINGIPIGARVVIAQAYNSSGTEIGYGTTSVTIASGSNSGVTITLSSGTFSYTITGMADVSAPTSSSGGGVTTYHYLFVNNYSGGTISVIKQETNAVVGTITIPNANAQLTKGAFNYDGTIYYVVDSTPGASRIYKVPITDTSTWSANTATVIKTFTANEGTPREILYEKTSAGGEYLWIGVQWTYSSVYKRVYVYRINLSDLTEKSGADSPTDSNNYEIVGFCDITVPNSDGKIIVLFTKNGKLCANVCYYDGGELLQPSFPNTLLTAVIETGSDVSGFGTANTVKSAGGLMPSATAYLPTDDNIYSVLFNNSTNRLSALTSYTNHSFAGALKLILPGGTYYGLNNSALKYATDLSAAPAGWTTLFEIGARNISANSFSDMAASSDGNYIYVTDFGSDLYPGANYGNKVYVKTLSNTSGTSPDYTITVGNNPFSIALKP